MTMAIYEYNFQGVEKPLYYMQTEQGREHRLPRPSRVKREATSRSHVQIGLDQSNDRHFLVATRQCSTSTCRMHLKVCLTHITIICDIILLQHHHCASVWRPKKKGAPVTLSPSSNGRCSAFGHRSIAPACLGSKSIKQIAVAFSI